MSCNDRTCCSHHEDEVVSQETFAFVMKQASEELDLEVIEHLKGIIKSRLSEIARLEARLEYLKDFESLRKNFNENEKEKNFTYVFQYNPEGEIK